MRRQSFKDREILCVLIHPPNGCNNWVWLRKKARASNSMLVSRMAGKGPSNLVSSLRPSGWWPAYWRRCLWSLRPGSWTLEELFATRVIVTDCVAIRERFFVFVLLSFCLSVFLLGMMVVPTSYHQIDVPCKMLRIEPDAYIWNH